MEITGPVVREAFVKFAGRSRPRARKECADRACPESPADGSLFCAAHAGRLAAVKEQLRAEMDEHGVYAKRRRNREQKEAARLAALEEGVSDD